MRFVDVDPVGDRAGWLKRRRDGLGGSDIAKIAGISKWGSPWAVYVDKLGLVDLDADPTAAQERGRYLEDGILAWYEDHTGFTVAHRQAMILHPDHDWCFVTVDGLVFESTVVTDPDLAVKGVDAKSATEWSWDTVPLDYQAQAQLSMAVTGLPEWDLAVSHPGGFQIYTVEADPADQRALLDAGRRFWFDHVQAGVPPEISGSDNDLLAAVWAEETPGTQVDVDAGLVLELVQVKAEQKRLTARRNELEAALKNRLGDTEEGIVDGRKVVSWKAQWGTNRFDENAFRADEPFMVHRFEHERVVKEIDVKQLKEEEPEVFKRYTKPTRVFRTHVKEE